MSLTKHSEVRIRKRIGLPKRTAARQAIKAFQHGKIAMDFEADFRRYIQSKETVPGITAKVYNGYVYIFGNNNALITAWRIPRQYWKRHASV